MTTGVIGDELDVGHTGDTGTLLSDGEHRYGQIDPDRGGRESRCADRGRAATATDIEHRFVGSELYAVKEQIPERCQLAVVAIGFGYPMLRLVTIPLVSRSRLTHRWPPRPRMTPTRSPSTSSSRPAPPGSAARARNSTPTSCTTNDATA